jgi:hypothetical protein
MYSINCNDALFGDQSLEGRHDRPVAGHDLGLRLQDGFADVAFVRLHGAAAGKLHGLAEQSGQAGAPAGAIGLVAVGAGQLVKQLLPFSASDPPEAPPLSQAS